MVVFFALIPGYLLIAGLTNADTTHAPLLALDTLIPLTPPWVLVYGTVYLFLILLPVLVIQSEDLIEGK